MPTPWFETYVRLSFRIEKVFQTLHGRRFIPTIMVPRRGKPRKRLHQCAFQQTCCGQQVS